jgi:hypothetical protein
VLQGESNEFIFGVKEFWDGPLCLLRLKARIGICAKAKSCILETFTSSELCLLGFLLLRLSLNLGIGSDISSSGDSFICDSNWSFTKVYIIYSGIN